MNSHRLLSLARQARASGLTELDLGRVVFFFFGWKDKLTVIGQWGAMDVLHCTKDSLDVKEGYELHLERALELAERKVAA